MAVPAFAKWPSSECAILSALVDALRSRSKAINNRVRRFDIELIHEPVDGIDFERLNLIFENWKPSPDRLSLAIWGDGTLWLDARRSSKNGWDYEFAFCASCAEIDAIVTRDTIEQSLWITDADEMHAVWAQFKPYRK